MHVYITTGVFVTKRVYASHKAFASRFTIHSQPTCTCIFYINFYVYIWMYAVLLFKAVRHYKMKLKTNWNWAKQSVCVCACGGVCVYSHTIYNIEYEIYGFCCWWQWKTYQANRICVSVYYLLFRRTLCPMLNARTDTLMRRKKKIHTYKCGKKCRQTHNIHKHIWIYVYTKIHHHLTTAEHSTDRENMKNYASFLCDFGTFCPPPPNVLAIGEHISSLNYQPQKWIGKIFCTRIPRIIHKTTKSLEMNMKSHDNISFCLIRNHFECQLTIAKWNQSMETMT